MLISKNLIYLPIKPLKLEKTYPFCAAINLNLKTTRDLLAKDEVLFQDRALNAINVGLGIKQSGYNIFISGLSGTGKTGIIKKILEEESSNKQSSQDWLYVYNFEKPTQPCALCLEAGQGSTFKKTVEEAVQDIQSELARALQSADYEQAVSSVFSQHTNKQSKKFNTLERNAKKYKFQIKSTQMGIETTPIIDGRLITDKEYTKLSSKIKEAIEKRRSKLDPDIINFVRIVRKLELESKNYVLSLQKKIGTYIVNKILDPLLDEYCRNKYTVKYLKNLKNDLLVNLSKLVVEDEQSGIYHRCVSNSDFDFNRYKVNLFIDNYGYKRIPIIIEGNPTYSNLFGKIEKNVDQGSLHADHLMVAPGSIHQANGGYLIIEAQDLLKGSFVWETFKRVLRNQKAFIEEASDQHSVFLATTSLRPDPIPLDLKVILIGTDDTYHLLYELDSDFAKIFKVKADFDYKMPLNAKTKRAYANFIACRVHKENLLHFTCDAVATIIEYGCRLVDNQNYLSTQFSLIKDLVLEADYFARYHSCRLVQRCHVEQAIDEKIYRSNLYEDQTLESFKSGDILFSLSGHKIGQVNALSVHEFADFSFGRVSRLTCVLSVSEDGILNIERAVKLSGNIHDKGIYILSGFLNSYLAQQHSLPLSASICFEQSYGVIDGDSASIAELTAVVSALSNTPIYQNLAMTGSLNQLGDIQAVGGVNEKIEGYARLIDRFSSKNISYIVIIPYANIANLVLNCFCRTLVATGKLKIIPVRFFWEVFEIATGVPFGARNVTVRNVIKKSALDKIYKRLKLFHKSTVE